MSISASYPNIRPTLLLDFVNSSRIDPRITFTRASTATYFDATGTLQTATTDVPRFDYDPDTLAAQGLLIEEARTNLIFPSEDFANATYTPTNITGVVNAAVAPNGATTADELVEDGATGAHGFLGPVVNLANATVYTCSIFAKVKSGTRGLFIYGQNVSAYSATNAGAKFTVSGTVISAGAVYGTSTNSVQSVGNGWYRCTVTFPATVAANAGQNLRIVLDNGTGTPTAGAASYTGDGTSGFFVWGAQLETGAFPTSYIPTTTTALTRAADVASVNTLSPWFNASAGSFYVQATTPNGLSTFPSTISVNDGTTSNRIISYVFTNGYYVGVTTAGVSQGNGFVLTTPTVGSEYKFAFVYATNRLQAALNGTAGPEDTTVTLPSGLNIMRIGGIVSSGNLYNSHIQRITYYPRSLSQAELISITA